MVCVMGGLLFPVLWLAVSFITSFSSTAFRNSPYCAGMSLPRYFEFMAVSSFTGVLDILGRRDLVDDFLKRRGLGFVSILFMLNWGTYLVHHREEIFRECASPIRKLIRDSRSAEKGTQCLQIVKECLLLVWRVPKVSWCAYDHLSRRGLLISSVYRTTIISYHPSSLVWLLLCLDWSWTLGISNALTFDHNQLQSYGQVLSIFVPVPALWSFGKILRSHKTTIIEGAKAIPSYIRQGICFTFTGRNEWPTVEKPPERDYFHWSRLRWVIGELPHSIFYASPRRLMFQ